MLRVTIDMNCIIALEEDEETSVFLQPLVAAHEEKELTICVPGISASERLRGGGYPRSFAPFPERIQRLLSRPAEILVPIGLFDVTFYHQSIYGDEESERLAEQIHSVLFNGEPVRCRDYAALHLLGAGTAASQQDGLFRDWRNHLCDTMALWCHIYYRCDHFVTNDKHSHGDKKPELLALGARSIIRPKDLPSIL